MYTDIAQSRSSVDTMASKEERSHGFSQAISEAFEPYMSLWVESQDKYVLYEWLKGIFLTNQTTSNLDTQVSAAAFAEFRRGVLASSSHTVINRVVPFLPHDSGTVC